MSLINRVKGAGQGAMAGYGVGGWPGAIAGGALGLLGSGTDQASQDAMKEQMMLQRMMADIYKKQSEIDLPYRKDLFSALRQRGKQQFPRFMPRKPQGFNPYNMRRRIQPKLKSPVATGSPRPTSGLYDAIMRSRSNRG